VYIISEYTHLVNYFFTTLVEITLVEITPDKIKTANQVSIVYGIANINNVFNDHTIANGA
jgi:hypothetical protein